MPDRLGVSLFLLGAIAAALSVAETAPPPTANDPQFDSKKYWPNLSGKEHYLKQDWPKTRVLVYGGMDANGKKTGGSGWVDLSTGKRAKGPDANTDIILPDSDKPYKFGRSGGKYRHVTVGRNAHMSGGGDGNPMYIFGNIWIREGGSMRAQGATIIAGERHTFYRNDNRCDEWNAPNWQKVSTSMYIRFAKVKGATAEVVGQIAMNDEFSITGCEVIIAPDSILQPGRNGHPGIQGRGKLILMDGAYYGVWTNNFDTPDLTVNGTVQAGTAERPLTRDAHIGVSRKNYDKVMYKGKGGPGKLERFGTKRVAGLVLHAGSALRAVPAGGSNARLVVHLSRDNWGWRIREEPGSAYEAKTLRKQPDAKYRYAWWDSLPMFIDVWFGPGVTVENVRLDHVRKGGLMLANPADRAKWSGVSFGEHCQAAGDALFSAVREIGRGGDY